MSEKDPFPKLLLASSIVVAMVGLASIYVTLQAGKAPSANSVALSPEIRLQLPDFEMTERSGGQISRQSLAGQVWIADFIFTSCAGPCPIMTQKMRTLQDELGEIENLKLVSISVDPERDTPEVLSRYATHYGADAQRWLFLTGAKEEMYDLAIDGFKLAVSEARDTDQIIHDTRFVLVDQSGAIRGYYDSTLPDTLQHLREDAILLSKEPSG